jgi:methylphosphotriester-DNA--protein-cysteine methyltransferase
MTSVSVGDIATMTAKTYRLLNANGRVYQSRTKGLFGGNARMKIYGRLDCPSALRAIRNGPTYARHRVFFADEASAVAAGYRPCGVCMRAAYRKWRTTKQNDNLPGRPNTKRSAYETNKKS